MQTAKIINVTMCIVSLMWLLMPSAPKWILKIYICYSEDWDCAKNYRFIHIGLRNCIYYNCCLQSEMKIFRFSSLIYKVPGNPLSPSITHFNLQWLTNFKSVYDSLKVRPYHLPPLFGHHGFQPLKEKLLDIRTHPV